MVRNGDIWVENTKSDEKGSVHPRHGTNKVSVRKGWPI